MIVDSNKENRFVTQRQHPKMALIVPAFVEEELHVNAPDMPTLKLSLAHSKDSASKPVSVSLWKDECLGADEGDVAAAWFSNYIGVSGLRLVRMLVEHTRAIDEKYQPKLANTWKESFTSYADGFPFLLTSTESLQELNNRIKSNSQSDDPSIPSASSSSFSSSSSFEPLPMERFRPNVVVTGGGKPFMEDEWKKLKIGQLVLHGAKKCTRCKLTTVDPAVGQFSGEEPLQTLKTFRQGLLKGGTEVCFGQNMVHEGEGELSVGQSVLLVE